MPKTTRRQMLTTAGLSLAAFGLGTQVRGNEPAPLSDFSGTPREVTESGAGWKYLPIDPLKAADDSYTMFADGACHYSSFRAIVTNVANALLATGNAHDAVLAKNYLAFPFYMMQYGQAGLAFYGSLCGAINGAAAALSVFVPNRDDKFAMIRDLAVYHEETPLPIYVPKGGNPEKIEPNPSKSILCHVALKNWAEHSKTTVEKRLERCNRLTSDIVVRAVQLLNEYHADRTKASESLLPLAAVTQSCTECHTMTQNQNQGRYKTVISKMNCAACHDIHPSGGECPR